MRESRIWHGGRQSVAVMPVIRKAWQNCTTEVAGVNMGCTGRPLYGAFLHEQGERRSMKFGVFYQIPCGPEQSVAQRYEDTLEQIELADELGFDRAWIAELHFRGAFSVMPSPLMLAAVAAQRTKRIRLGIAVNLLPSAPPGKSRGRCRHLRRAVRRAAGVRNRAWHTAGPPRLRRATGRQPAHGSWKRLDILKKVWTEDHVTLQRAVLGDKRRLRGP